MIRIISGLPHRLEFDKCHPELNEDRILRWGSHLESKNNEVTTLHVSLNLNLQLSISNVDWDAVHDCDDFINLCEYINEEAHCDLLVTSQGIILITPIGFGVEFDFAATEVKLESRDRLSLSLSCEITKIIDEKGLEIKFDERLLVDDLIPPKMTILFHNSDSYKIRSLNEAINIARCPPDHLSTPPQPSTSYSHDNSLAAETELECFSGECGSCLTCRVFNMPSCISSSEYAYLSDEDEEFCLPYLYSDEVYDSE